MCYSRVCTADFGLHLLDSWIRPSSSRLLRGPNMRLCARLHIGHLLRCELLDLVSGGIDFRLSIVPDFIDVRLGNLHRGFDVWLRGGFNTFYVRRDHLFGDTGIMRSCVKYRGSGTLRGAQDTGRLCLFLGCSICGAQRLGAILQDALCGTESCASERFGLVEVRRGVALPFCNCGVGLCTRFRMEGVGRTRGLLSSGINMSLQHMYMI